MAKPPKGARAGQTPATDADHEQQGGELPQEPISNATNTPQPDADAGTGPAGGAGSGEGSDSDPDNSAANKAPGDAAGAGPAPLTGEQGSDGQGSSPVTDERILVRFTGPWKNYSRGDITRLSSAEAELVLKRTLAESEHEQAEE